MIHGFERTCGFNLDKYLYLLVCQFVSNWFGEQNNLDLKDMDRHHNVQVTSIYSEKGFHPSLIYFMYCPGSEEEMAI